MKTNNAKIMRGALCSIVALTAHAMVEDQHKCIDAGMDDYITKPLELAQLRRVLLDASSCVTSKA